jgi:tRNA 2-thiouridine synthesizing protein B
MVLHTLNASPSSAAYSDCLRLLRAGDALLLMGDGVYAALADTETCKALLSRDIEVYLLDGDVLAAGVQGRIGLGTLLDMSEFVGLTERYERQLAWY